MSRTFSTTPGRHYHRILTIGAHSRPRTRMSHCRQQTQLHQKLPFQQRTTSDTSNPFLLKPQRDFRVTESSRPAFDRSLNIEVSKTPDPKWVSGKGVNDTSGIHLKHVEIDPYQKDRSFISNYRLLIACIPRPISFVSTLSKNGRRNLAPFSYFQVVDHDPPIFVGSFSARKDRLKDTRRNLIETGECVINIVSEHMIEAVNSTSLDVSYGVSE